LPGEPVLAELTRPRTWRLREAGTLTARHYANMSLKSLGCVPIDPARLAGFFPPRVGGVQRGERYFPLQCY
jgi:hypothetical protein